MAGSIREWAGSASQHLVFFTPVKALLFSSDHFRTTLCSAILVPGRSLQQLCLRGSGSLGLWPWVLREQGQTGERGKGAPAVRPST